MPYSPILSVYIPNFSRTILLASLFPYRIRLATMSALHYPDRGDGQIDRYGRRIARRTRFTYLSYLQFPRTFRAIVVTFTHIRFPGVLQFCHFRRPNFPVGLPLSILNYHCGMIAPA